MKQYLPIIILLLTGCVTQPEKADFVNPIGFQPVAPIDISQQFSPDIILLAEFPNDAVSVAVREVKQGASLTYGPAKLSAKDTSYEVKVDYIKYRTKKYDDAEEIVREGFGVRIIASITTNEDKIDLGSLYALGVAAENSKLTGTLTMETMGISGETITPLIPIPSKIDVSTIQNVLQAAAAIKSKIYDESKGVTVRPQVLSFRVFDTSDEKGTVETTQAENVKAASKTKDAYSGNKWIYFGHLVNGGYAETATTDAQGLPAKDTVYTVVKDVNIRTSYPTFPMYRISDSLGIYKEGDKIKVLEVQKVGLNKIWARVVKQ